MYDLAYLHLKIVGDKKRGFCSTMIGQDHLAYLTSVVT